MSARKTKAPPAANDPADVRAEVWLTDPAIDDLRRLDGSALIWALKKMLLLERNPLAGEPLGSELSGWRKLVIGDRHWRLIWRPVIEPSGALTIEVAEVWAVGARAEAEVYQEMTTRIAQMGDSPVRTSLEKAIRTLGAAAAVSATPPAVLVSPPEPWLVDRLVYTAGIDRDRVQAMSSEQAVDAWTDYITGQQKNPDELS